MLSHSNFPSVSLPTLSVGRFAPTPSGCLHFGSLVAALGSYLVARQAGGRWFLRVEDLDPPREVKGAAAEILKTLQAFGFEWDGEVSYQSQRQQYYHQALEQLKQSGMVYACNCSRKQLQQRSGGVYDGHCRERKLDEAQDVAWRIRFGEDFARFTDRVLGDCCFDQPADIQDFVVRRRDGLFAYQLAVVVDDIAQGVTQVVRGADILDSTPRQNYLYQALGYKPPAYYHLPLVVDGQGEKLSKHKFSPAIGAHNASLWLVRALAHLGQLSLTESDKNLTGELVAELSAQAPDKILRWALENWQLEKVGRKSKKVCGSFFG